MSDIYEIKLSIYVRADSLESADSDAHTYKGALEGYTQTYMPAEALDEITIDSVIQELLKSPPN